MATTSRRAAYLAPMLHGDEVWCQLFSEPAAGSDLAGIQTRARQNEDGTFTLNGQKVWTTNAQFASFGLLLARTDPDVPKHKGLTMFIVPMDAEGVTVRGLRQITGEAEFNEVFFDDVAIDSENVVGGVGNGWGTALTTLMFERLTIGFGSESFGSPTRLAETLGADAAARRDQSVRQTLGEIVTDMTAVRFTGYRALTALQQGQIPGPEAGLAKVTMVNAGITAMDLAVDVLGPEALATDSDWFYLTSFLPGLKSAGGTEQILRNTIGERVLGSAAGTAARQGDPLQRAARQGEGGVGVMNLALTDEQQLLREAARNALSRQNSIAAARDALEDPNALPDLWPTAVDAGWPGLLISEDRGGAGLGVFEAMLVAEECGRVLASVPLLGLVPATAILNAAGDESLEAVANGGLRPAYLPARPPGELEDGWSVDPGSGWERAEAPRAEVDGAEVVLDGTVAFVPEAPDADLLVAVGRGRGRQAGGGCRPGGRRRRARSNR